MAGILLHVELLAERIGDATAWPFTIPAIAKLGRLEFAPAVTFLVGENGSGKSTLLEAIARKAGFPPRGGSKNFRSEEEAAAAEGIDERLPAALRLARGPRRERGGFFLRAETLHHVASEAVREQYGHGWIDLHRRSHGESFLWVALERFVAGGLYLLDEPESALSATRQLALLARMQALAAEGSQFVVATHSPILLGYPDARIVQLDDAGWRTVAWQETDAYQITRRFLAAPETLLSPLLSPPLAPPFRSGSDPPTDPAPPRR
ncbi:MAG: AAA family ATPase [Planctomycetes bacterium]|nr:AAA family ATPase [Planctomycetota bacterium]